jgi:orotidine-5'-phosphate decarboxylase
VKRNDIGSTAEAYAEAYLGEVFDADSVTVNGYLGSDGIKPFVKIGAEKGKGLFVLVKTSNKSSGELQDLFVFDEVARGKDAKALYEIMGGYVDSWGADEIGEKGYSLVGAVVGATYPEQAKVLREIMPSAFFLVPGYGAQGGGAADVKPCFNKDGLGAIVNSSRGIIFAYEEAGKKEEGFAEAAREATLAMKKDLDGIF